ncbi:MAG: DUF1304 domain-containing protein [Bdellovibrionales bacterium]|nr:DUF1304 domain-containing protein [Bdellovibrionales bacterium]
MLVKVLVVLIAVEHVYFMVLEMFLWDKPYGLKVFGQTMEQAQASKSLAANQGLYNGFLAAGLLWSLTLPVEVRDTALQFFLTCIAVAGVFGSMTAVRSILYVQALPALIALACLTLLL